MNLEDFVNLEVGSIVKCVDSYGWGGGPSIFSELEDTPEFEVGMEFVVIREYINKIDPDLLTLGTIVIADSLEDPTWKQSVAGMFSDDFEIVEEVA